MEQFYFTVGPAQIHPKVLEYSSQFYNEGLGSVSHRSEAFRNMYKEADRELRLLLNVPDDFAILFLSSASEIFERLLLNCVHTHSFHAINGSFAHKFYKFSLALGKKAVAQEFPLGTGFTADALKVPADAELICLTHNETSTGVSIPENTIAEVHQRHPNALLAVDIVSSAPNVRLDFTQLDMAFFSVQKAFGLPSGLGVWFIRQSAVEKVQHLAKTQMVGAQNTLDALIKNYKNFETPSTPNIYNIYLLGKIAGEYNRYGVEKLRAETKEKATMLYDFLEQSVHFKAFVQDPQYRSETVIVVDCLHHSPTDVISKLKSMGLTVSSGYASLKDRQIRVANFPVVTKEKIQELIDSLGRF